MSMQSGPPANPWPQGPDSQAPYAAPYAPPRPPAPTSKPATLAISFWLSVVVAVLSIAGALIMIFNGKDTIRAYVEKSVSDTLGTTVSPDIINATVGDELDTAYNKLVVKAVIGLVVAVLILVFALVARNASTPGRVLLTIALVVGMCAGSGLQLQDMDVNPGATIAIASVTPLLSLIAIVCAFLPATNRYAQARKLSR
jgi:hypothetical protein